MLLTIYYVFVFPLHVLYISHNINTLCNAILCVGLILYTLKTTKSRPEESA